MELLSVAVKGAGYSKEKHIITDINFTLLQGELIGLIGPNGAGKSTIIKTILGLLSEVVGEVSFSPATNKYAYIPEQPVYYDELTLWEHLELAKVINGIDDHAYELYAEQLLEIFRLQKAKHQYPTSFSKGMQQKLMIIVALLIKPRVYIIDEPFIGLDPKAIKDFLNLLEEERKRGAAILMSTHVLDTAERICDRFLLINEGKVMSQGNLQELRRESGIAGSLMDCFYYFMEQKRC